MSPALVISRREIRTYFNSPVAYIVVTVFTILTGYLFFTQLFVEKQAEMRGFFGIMPLLFMFLAPAITMRLLADEKAAGTLELLITMPVREWQVVVGKYLAAMALLCTALALTLVFAITVRSFGPLDRGPAIGGYVGLVLMGGAYVAIGVMTSSFTRNSIISFIVAFAISFVLYLIGRLTQFVPQSLQGADLVPQHRQPLREHQPRRHRQPRRHLLLLGDRRLPAVATLSLESRKWR